eukprot:5530963-Amphidinium_carterae.1
MASVYSPLEKRQLLVLATVHLCRLHTVGAHDIEVLVGHWIHHAMFHRSCMCVMDTVFAWLHSPTVAGRKRVMMPRRVRSELLGMAIMAPLL